MTQSLGAQLGLLAFAAAIGLGLAAQNSALTILFRAIVVLVVVSTIAQLIAWSARVVLADGFRREKARIDVDHLAEMRKIESGNGAGRTGGVVANEGGN